MTYSDVTVLIPTFGDCRTRLENQAFVLRWYAERDIATVLGRDAARPYFARTSAVNYAARAAVRDYPDRKVFIVADNDLIPSEPHLLEALARLHEFAAVTPHSITRLTTPEAREDVLSGREPRCVELTAQGSRSYVVIHHAVFNAVNGMDEDFRGWGPEDKAFLASINRQVGPVLELSGRRLHLWHPTDPTKQDRRNLTRLRHRARAYSRATPEQARVLARQYGRWNDESRDRLAERDAPPADPRSGRGDSLDSGRHPARPHA